MDIDKIKNASTAELIEQLGIIEEKMADRMFPVSYVEAQRLGEWKVGIQEELYVRKIIKEF